MSPEVEAAQRKWIIAREAFWAGVIPLCELEDAEAAFYEAGGRPIWETDDAA